MKANILFEILWWGITFVLVVLLLFPIYNAVGLRFPFYIENIIFIVIAVSFIRFIFLMPYHKWLQSKAARVVLIFLPVGIFMYLVDNVYDFQAFLDEEGIMSIMSHLPGKDQMMWSKFIKNEMLVFWSAAFISNLILPFRMLYSLSKSFRNQ